MVRDFGKLITKVVRRSVDASNRHALSDMLDVKVNPFPKWGEFFRDQMTPRSVQMIKWLGDALKEYRVVQTGNAAGGSKPALNTSSQLSEPLRAGAPHPQPQSPPRMPERDH